MTHYARDWRPINYQGTIHHDPRRELAARVRRARDGNDTYVAVPLALAARVAEFVECSAHTVLTRDEDGPLPEPVEIVCRLEAGHSGSHHNGYTSWTRR